MSEGSHMDGTVVSYDDMTPISVTSYDQTNSALVMNNPVQANEGITSAESETVDFHSPATFNNTMRVGYNGEFADSVPMISPPDSTSLIFPAINSAGAIQATESMIANNGATRLYAGDARTHIIGDITVDGSITNTNLQSQLDSKHRLIILHIQE